MFVISFFLSNYVVLTPSPLPPPPPLYVCFQGWVHEMYTAVSLVQAKNNDHAEKVGDAMKSHAEMGLLRRQQQRERREQECTGKGSSGPGGSSKFVSRRRESIGLTGDMDVDAGRQVQDMCILKMRRIDLSFFLCPTYRGPDRTRSAANAICNSSGWAPIG